MHHNPLSLSYTSTDDDLPLVHPQLIQWDQQAPPRLDLFGNDEAIAEFMGLREGIPSRDHKVGYIMDLDSTTYFGDSTPPSSHKSENEKKRSPGENWKAPLDHKKVKIKDVSEGENLFEEPKDGGLDVLKWSKQLRGGVNQLSQIFN